MYQSQSLFRGTLELTLSSTAHVERAMPPPPKLIMHCRFSLSQPKSSNQTWMKRCEVVMHANTSQLDTTP